MKFSNTLLFSILFLIVLVFYLRLDMMPHPQAKTPGMVEVTGKILPLQEGDVIRLIQIQKAGDTSETITLEKRADQWMLTFPISYPADPLVVQGLASALTASDKLRRLKPEKGWEEYGLTKPPIKVGIETQKNSQRRYLYFGNLNPVGDFVFARWEKDREYFLVSPQLKSAFSPSVYSLRFKKIFFTPLRQLSKIHVRTPNGEYELARHHEKWFWMEPIPILGEPVSSAEMADILNRIQNLYVKDFLDDQPLSKEETGFSILGNSIKIWGEKDAAETLPLGREVPAKNALYAKKENGEVIFLVAQANISELFNQIATLADNALAEQTKQKDILDQAAGQPAGTVAVSPAAVIKQSQKVS